MEPPTRPSRDPAIAEMDLESVQTEIAKHVNEMSLRKARTHLRLLIDKKTRKPVSRVRRVTESTWCATNTEYILRVLGSIESMQFAMLGLPNRGYSLKVCAIRVLELHITEDNTELSTAERTRRLLCIGEALTRLTKEAQALATEEIVIVKHESKQGHGKLRGSGIALDAGGAETLRAAAKVMRERLTPISTSEDSDH